MHSFRIPISKLGAVFRLLLGAVITFMAALLATHTLNKPIDFWAVFGAALLTLKDIQSFINQAWGQAFLTSPLTAPAEPQTGITPQ